MGKRKSKARVMKKERPTLSTIFDCIFCNHSKSVEAKIDRDSSTGSITCRICGEKFQAIINSLDEPIDIYSKWIDECEKLNR